MKDFLKIIALLIAFFAYVGLSISAVDVYGKPALYIGLAINILLSILIGYLIFKLK